MQNVKVLFAGDAGSGKSSLIEALKDSDDKSLITSSQSVHVMVDGKPFEVSLYDTDYDQKEQSSYYTHTDIFILCVDISNYETFINNPYQQIYIDQMRKSEPNAPIIIIATKSDLRWKMDHDSLNKDLKLISMHDLKEFCVNSGCLMCIEASAKCNESIEIRQMFREIIRKLPRSQKKMNGFTIPRFYSSQTEYHYDESKDHQINIKSAALLIHGFVHKFASNDDKAIIPKDIIILIGSFWIPPMEISYFENKTSGHISMAPESFGADKELKKDYYIMFSIDLFMIIIHNLAYYFFSIQLLLLVQKMEIAAYLALTVTVLESLLIIIGYGLLFLHSKMKYYTYPMSMMQIMIELFVNFPVSLIQIIYLLFNIEDSSHALIPSFYVSITIYFFYGLYKYFINGIYWALRNKLLWEKCYVYCVFGHGLIWFLAMFSFIVIGIIFIVRDSKNPIAITLMIMAIISCGVVGSAGIPLLIILDKKRFHYLKQLAEM